MQSNSVPICVEHRQSKQWQLTTFEYEEEGISVRVPNVYAWICPENGEASFTPETVDELILTERILHRARHAIDEARGRIERKAAHRLVARLVLAVDLLELLAYRTRALCRQDIEGLGERQTRADRTR